MGCRFCFLTAQGQTSFKHADLDAYTKQLDLVLSAHDRTASRLNVNLMARGEPLANKVIVKRYSDFYDMVENRAARAGFDRFSVNVSTIMPKASLPYHLPDVFERPVHLYYSLYSTNKHFREKWLPNAMGWRKALERLAEFQEETDQPLTFHWALIKGENDSIKGARELAKALRPYRFNAKFNLVRFNPHPSLSYEEPDEARRKEILSIVREVLHDPRQKSRIVPRVGRDVFASCGMFVEK